MSQEARQPAIAGHGSQAAVVTALRGRVCTEMDVDGGRRRIVGRGRAVELLGHVGSRSESGP